MNAEKKARRKRLLSEAKRINERRGLTLAEKDTVDALLIEIRRLGDELWGEELAYMDRRIAQDRRAAREKAKLRRRRSSNGVHPTADGDSPLPSS